MVCIVPLISLNCISQSWRYTVKWCRVFMDKWIYYHHYDYPPQCYPLSWYHGTLSLSPLYTNLLPLTWTHNEPPSLPTMKWATQALRAQVRIQVVRLSLLMIFISLMCELITWESVLVTLHWSQ